jgi:membrane protein YqaA with SNARE-associated domain
MVSSALWWLFASAFVSSTLMPGGSEVVFAALVHQGAEAPGVLLAVAALGNTLGGMTSWGLGRAIAWRFPSRRLEARHRHAVERVQRFGAVALLLSWVPVMGDPLCVAAGWLKVHWLQALLFIAVGKTARYAAILLAFH